MKRLLMAVLVISITIPLVARSADESDQFEGFEIVDDDMWKDLSGASQNSKGPLRLDQFDQVDEKWDNYYNKETIWGLLSLASYGRNSSYMKTTGNESLCRCLGDNLPAFVSFEGYVSIIIGKRV